MLLVDLYPTFFWFNDSYVVLKYFNFFIMKCLHNVITFIYFIHLDAGTSVGGIEGEQMRLREGFVGSRSSSKDD